MAQSPIKQHEIQFNAIEFHWLFDLVDQPYGGSGKPSQQRKLISLIWFVGGVSWSAHQIQIKQIHSFLWKDELLIEFACCSLPQGSLTPSFNQNQIKNNFWFSFAFIPGSLSHLSSIEKQVFHIAERAAKKRKTI